MIMQKKLTMSNFVQFTGRIVHKNFDENNNRLFIVLSLFSPKWVVSKNVANGNMNRDYPDFIIDGDKAVKFNEEFREGDHVTLFGYSDTREHMIYVGNNLYRKSFDVAVYVEDMMKDDGHENINIVFLDGEVTRVYRNDAVGKKLYIITLSTTLSDGSTAKTSFTHFDIDMSLEPKVGDRIVMNGSVHTKNIENNDNGARPRKLVSIVSKSTSIFRK